MKSGRRQSVPAAELTLPTPALLRCGSSGYHNSAIRMLQKKAEGPPAAAVALGAAALERSERRKQSRAESLIRNGSSGSYKKDHEDKKNTFLQHSRSGSGDDYTVKRSGSGNGDNNMLLLSSSPPVDKRQYKTSSSPGLSPNITRQKKIVLSSASKTFRQPKKPEVTSRKKVIA